MNNDYTGPSVSKYNFYNIWMLCYYCWLKIYYLNIFYISVAIFNINKNLFTRKVTNINFPENCFLYKFKVKTIAYIKVIKITQLLKTLLSRINEKCNISYTYIYYTFMISLRILNICILRWISFSGNLLNVKYSLNISYLFLFPFKIAFFKGIKVNGFIPNILMRSNIKAMNIFQIAIQKLKLSLKMKKEEHFTLFLYVLSFWIYTIKYIPKLVFIQCIHKTILYRIPFFD